MAIFELDFMFRPIAAVYFEGLAASALVSNAISSIVISDEIGMESDSCEITLDDRGFILPEFKPAMEIAPVLGYIGARPLFMGKFALETIREQESVSGCILSLSAKAADLVESSLKYPRDGFFRNKTIGDIVDEVAGRAGFKAVVDESLKSIPLEHLTQRSQSDLDLLSRLAKQYGAVFSVKKGQLIIKPPFNGRSAKGKELTPLTIERGDYESLVFTSSKRGEVAGVTASHWSQNQGRRIKSSVGSKENSFHLKGNFENEAQAKAAAQAAFVRSHAGKKELQITIKGNTAYKAGFPVEMKHPKARMAGRWIISKVRHSFTKDKGYICELTLKAPEEMAKEFAEKQKKNQEKKQGVNPSNVNTDSNVSSNNSGNNSRPNGSMDFSKGYEFP